MFDRLCAWLASHLGHSGVFAGCLIAVITGLGLAVFVPSWRDGINLWAGAISGYVSILLLVVLQNSQTRGDAATHLKLDALISVNRDLSNRLISIEHRPVQEIVEEAERMRVELRED